MRRSGAGLAAVLFLLGAPASFAQEWWKPYSPPCTEREAVFEFAEQPAVKVVGKDRYEITFAVKGYCDVTVAIVDPDPEREFVKGRGVVVRHLASGVLGPNAPAPFQRDSLRQTLYWNGKCDLDLYHRYPERLRVRVMLGLKPVFDKRLRGTSPKNVAGYVWSIGLAPDAAYVVMKGNADWGHVTIRKFDRDGGYVSTLVPPPAAMPLDKLAGDGFVEYEPGKRVWHGRNLYQSVAHDGFAFPSAHGKGLARCQIAVVGNRIIYASGGEHPFSEGARSCLHWVHTDGSTDPEGLAGTKQFAWGRHSFPMLAASPDGKWLYMVSNAFMQGDGFRAWDPVLVRAPADGSGPATTVAGERGKPGSGNEQLNGTAGIDCDGQGRVYVSDSANNRVQVFSPEGKHLKTIPVDRPRLIQVHRKTGAIYVQHAARVQGQSVAHLTKLTSFENPTEEFHVEGLATSLMALDSWSARPRLWMAGSEVTMFARGKTWDSGPNVMVFEEDGKALKKIIDFDEEARKEDGEFYAGRWSGSAFDMVYCDPTREQVYYGHSIHDLRSGLRQGAFTYPSGYGAGWSWKDIAFDKRGYMHIHHDPTPGSIARVDPGQARKDDKDARLLVYPEVPYDYGVEGLRRPLVGVIPTRCQPGAKTFQDGMGVNMQGEIAVQSNIYYVPRMEEHGYSIAAAGILDRTRRGEYSDAPMTSYENYMRTIQDAERRGEEVYFIRRQPGVPLAGATVWTFERSGELRDGPAVLAGKLLAGVQMDEEGFLYFVNSRPRLIGGRPFLAGRGGWNGSENRSDIFTGTLVKTRGRAGFVSAKAPVPMSEPLNRPPELAGGYGEDQDGVWVEGAEWTYAGAGPVVYGGCSCPSSRLHLDWYKRVYVPEAYRHSIGILDTNGNLIMHLGRYGNFDDAPGGKNGAKPGGVDIGIMLVRFVSGTDNYLVYGDWDEKAVVLRLDYHAEATAGIIGSGG